MHRLVRRLSSIAPLLVVTVFMSGCTSDSSDDPQAYQTPSISPAEERFMAEWEGLKKPSLILNAGYAWCEFFANDRTQVAAFNSVTWADLSKEFEDWAIMLALESSRKHLCSSDYRLWSNSMPDVYIGPEEDYDLIPDSGEYEIQPGPRG